MHYIDKTTNDINKINRDLLLTEKYPVDLVTKLYSAAESTAVRNVSDLDIESEYLYWANDSHEDGHGGVHKAFTQPFIKKEPF